MRQKCHPLIQRLIQIVDVVVAATAGPGDVIPALNRRQSRRSLINPLLYTRLRRVVDTQFVARVQNPGRRGRLRHIDHGIVGRIVARKDEKRNHLVKRSLPKLAIPQHTQTEQICVCARIQAFIVEFGANNMCCFCRVKWKHKPGQAKTKQQIQAPKVGKSHS